MPRALRPWFAAGMAFAGVGIVVANPAATPDLKVQQRSVALVSTDYGVAPFPEVDWTDLVANTKANWTGLMDLFKALPNLSTTPSVFTEGLPKVFNDLSTELQQLSAYDSAYQAALMAQNGELAPVPTADLPPLPDLYLDPVLNPVSVVSLLAQGILSPEYGLNAAETGATGIYQNMLPSINDISAQVHNIVGLYDTVNPVDSSSDSLQADLASIAADATQIEKFLSLAPTTILNDYLNGYPVQAATSDASYTTKDAYTLNAPYNSSDNVAISPELGLLTNADAAITTTDAGGTASTAPFDGTVPLETGTIASLLQIDKTLSDELLTVTSTINSSVSAPVITDSLTVLGPDSLGITINLDNIPVVGPLIYDVNHDVIPFLNGTLVTFVGEVNKAAGGLTDFINDTQKPLEDLVNGTVNPFINGVDGFIGVIDHLGAHVSKISDVNVTIPNVTIPTLNLSDYDLIKGDIPTDPEATIPLPDVTIPAGLDQYIADIANNDSAILSSFAGIAAPVSGTVGSSESGNFLAPDPVVNLGAGIDSFLNSFTGELPTTFTLTAPLDVTNLITESLDKLFTAAT